MLIPNCLFRIGGAAVVLSNRRVDRLRAKYAFPYTPAASRPCLFTRQTYGRLLLDVYEQAGLLLERQAHL